MSNEQEERIPGITFSLLSTSHSKPNGRGGHAFDIKLHAVTTDLDLWGAVEKKFKEGIRVFTDDDFHTSVMSAMRDRIEELEQELARLRASNDILMKDNARLEGDAKKYKEPFRRLGQALNRGSTPDEETR